MGEEELQQLLKACLKEDRKAQKSLYAAFYGFAMGICLRYACDRDEAAEVMNRGFLKVFTHISKYNETLPFKPWIGRIMINASIDFYRSKLKMAYTEDIDEVDDLSGGELPDKKLDYDDLLKMVQALPQGYRTVFNLFAIEGYSHDEIAAMLHINAGTSKSNLHKARQKLKQMILNADASANSSNYNRDMQYTQAAINGVDKPGVFLNKDTRE